MHFKPFGASFNMLLVCVVADGQLDVAKQNKSGRPPACLLLLLLLMMTMSCISLMI
jgi:hypothetical protein